MMKDKLLDKFYDLIPAVVSWGWLLMIFLLAWVFSI
jgi:hypothetical protein